MYHLKQSGAKASKQIKLEHDEWSNGKYIEHDRNMFIYKSDFKSKKIADVEYNQRVRVDFDNGINRNFAKMWINLQNDGPVLCGASVQGNPILFDYDHNSHAAVCVDVVNTGCRSLSSSEDPLAVVPPLVQRTISDRSEVHSHTLQIVDAFTYQSELVNIITIARELKHLTAVLGKDKVNNIHVTDMILKEAARKLNRNSLWAMLQGVIVEIDDFSADADIFKKVFSIIIESWLPVFDQLDIGSDSPAGMTVMATLEELAEHIKCNKSAEYKTAGKAVSDAIDSGDGDGIKAALDALRKLTEINIVLRNMAGLLAKRLHQFPMICVGRVAKCSGRHIGVGDVFQMKLYTIPFNIT